ncbi:prephenate dehydratase [Thermocoleostomius sinensis]|uniref:Prephenate dehydratase n=1 Tax=Thermocoleostomius sinensis A174 TaxID=2016057 RepID=A0A9E8ZDY0_9CYAN|nr:prephenate dehydratase [Thermocoleostomius sinensis]WAL61554.1 prephenate dehydratase [Thermocoleostomius sinensis A174]
MTFLLAHLGPTGTYAESAAIAWATHLKHQTQEEVCLLPCASIAQTLRMAAEQQVDFAVVPVENSIEGSVTVTLDTLWQLDSLRVQQALVLPISHALLSCAPTLQYVQTVYSHPQALAQCQGWLEKNLPTVQLVPANSTTEALQFLSTDETVAAIASQRAAELYNLPVLVHPINDHPDNCTRFWVLSLKPLSVGSHTSLAFSLPANVPGALVKPLQLFAKRGINLSRIESRPTKRSLGEYVFFIDFESSIAMDSVRSVLEELQNCTETLKVFGSYNISFVDSTKT